MSLLPGLAGWRRSVDRTGLQSDSLRTGKFTGNFGISGLLNMVSKLKTAVPQRFLTKFSPQTNRENILRIRQFLGGIRECNLRRGKRGVGGGPFLKCKLTSTSARCSYRWASIRYFQLCKGSNAEIGKITNPWRGNVERCPFPA